MRVCDLSHFTEKVTVQTFLSKPGLSQQVFADSLKRRHTEHKLTNNDTKQVQKRRLLSTPLSFACFVITVNLSSQWPWSSFVQFIKLTDRFFIKIGRTTPTRNLGWARGRIWLKYTRDTDTNLTGNETAKRIDKRMKGIIGVDKKDPETNKGFPRIYIHYVKNRSRSGERRRKRKGKN